MVAIRRFEIDADEIGVAARDLNQIYEELENDHVGEDELVLIAQSLQCVIEALSDWLVTLHAEAVAA